MKTPPRSNRTWGSDESDPDAPGVGVASPFRVCDVVAVQLASLDGTPACALSWSLAKRDAATSACARFLAKYGERYADIRVPSVHDGGANVAHLKFPGLGHPATAEEARRGVAIFSMEGQGEVRLVKMPPFPLQAQWITNKDFPIDELRGNNAVVRTYDQDGWVWQAEEVRSGDRWERSYGFVGNSIVASVPASEIEFATEYYQGSHLPDGLDARLSSEPVAPRLSPGGPAVFSLHLRNRRGLPRSVPTEFVRDGKALRRGLTIGVEYLPKDSVPAAHAPDAKWQALTPRVTDVFAPGDAAKTLEAAEEFEAFRLDLAERFDFSKPGYYRVTATFEDKSGVGPGKASWMIPNGQE